MVCNRCIMVVRQELEMLGISPKEIALGEVLLAAELTAGQKATLAFRLEQLGFALIDDKKSRLIEQVKTLIIRLVHHQPEALSMNLSDYLSEQMHHEYSYLSHVFSEVEGTTIEKYFIAQKIEKVKELLVYDELTLSQIADLLHYSSVAHLSNQFKKVTGLSASHFKKIKELRRKGLDQV